MFREGFNTPPNIEVNGATSGTDELGTAWSTTCPSCVPAVNTFQKQGVRFECHNSKGLGTWTTNPINVSQTVKLQFLLTFASSLAWAGPGNMESNTECNFGNLCLGDPNFPSQGDCDQCWDFLTVDLIVDGSTIYTETIGNGNNLMNYIFMYTSPCYAPGTYNSAVIKVRAQNWSSDEFIYFDDVILKGYIQTPATLNLTQIGPYCENDNSTIPLVATPSGGTWSGAGVMANTFSPVLAGSGTHTLTYTYQSVSTGNCPISEDIQVLVNPATTPTFNAIPPQCVGGSSPLPTTSINGISGTWTPAFDPNANGTYTFTPGANQCATSAMLAITITAPITPTFNAIPPQCAGGSSPLPTTSINGISGTWTPAFDPNANGTYTFTPGANQCATSAMLAITITAPITPTFNAIPPQCAGGSSPLPTTSINGISGTWTPAFDPNANGTYTFTPGANQCATSAMLAITITAPITPTFNAIPAQCAGGSSPLPTTSTNGISGTWTPAFDPNANGTYTFTPGANQCATSAMLAITITAPITPTFNAIPAQCAGGSSPLPTTSINGISGTWTPAFDPNANGTYTFTPGANQCATSAMLAIIITAPITPTFNAIPAQCAGGSSPLPTTSINGISGTWTPAFDPNANGTYTFTPGANQCATSAMLAITITAPITPTFNAIPAQCAGGSSPLPTTSINGISGTWNPAFNPNNTATYSFMPNTGQCATGQTLSVFINALPIVSVTPAGPICTVDMPITLMGSPLGGMWTGQGVVGNTFDPFIAGVGNWPVTYTFTDGNGCSNSANTSIVVTACGCMIPITVDAGPNQQICANENPQVNGSVVNSAAFLWTSSGDGTFDVPTSLMTNYNPGPMDIALGTVNIILTAPDPDGPGPCIAVTDFLVLTIFQPPSITLAGNINLCLNDCGSFPVNITGGSGGPFKLDFNITNGAFNYNFSDPIVNNGEIFMVCFGGTGPSFNTVTNTLNLPAATNPGDYSISITSLLDNNIAGCIGVINMPNTLNVTINGSPSITLSGNAGLCPGECENVSFNISGGSGLYEVDFLISSPLFSYNFSDNTLSASNSFTLCYSGLIPSYNVVTKTITIPSFVAPGLLNITVTSLEDSNSGCSGIINMPNNLGITLYSNPVVSLTQVGNQCLNDPAITLVGSPAGGIWSGAGVTGNTFTPSAAGVGSWQVTYVYTDANGCNGTNSMNILVSDCGCPNPAIADAGIDIVICNGEVADLAGSVNTTAIWSSSGTGTFTNPNASVTTYNPSAADYISGMVILTLTATDPDGAGPCSQSSDQLILTFSSVNVSIDPVPDICLNDSPIVLSATPPGGIWTGVGVSGNIFDPSVAGIGTAQLIYEYTDANDCSDAETLAIEVLDCGCSDPSSALAGIDQLICIGNMVTLSGSVNHSATWSTSGTGSFSSITDINATYTPSAADISAGSVVITLTDSDPDGPGPCASASDQMIITFDVINIVFDPVAPVCVDDAPAILTATPMGGSWSGLGVTGNNFDPGVAGPGTHTIIYTVINTNNCTSTKSFQIVVKDCNCPNPASADAGNDLIVCGNQLILLNGTVSTNPSWSTSGTGFFDDPNLALTIYNASVADFAAGSVILTLTSSDPDGAGPCSAASDQATITFQSSLNVKADPVADLCISSGTVTLTGSPGGGSWTGTGVTGNIFDPTVSGVGSFILTYNVNNGGCSGSDVITVNVVDVTQANVSQLPDFCIGDPSIVLNIGTPAGGSYYLNGNFATPITMFSPNALGTQTITYILGSAPCNSQAFTVFKVLDCGCPNPATADAGIDQVACNGSTFSLAGIITGANSAMWTTAGDGIFGNANSLLSSYTPGPNDVLNGSVIITLTTEDPDGAGPCNPASNTMTITINSAPIISFQTVGDLCLDDLPVNLSATPSGGVFTGNGVSGNVFNPTTAGVGEHTIYYKALNGTCLSIDSITIVVTNCDCNNNLTVNVGPDTTICMIAPVQLNYVITGIATGTWTSSGSGTFTSTSISNPLYTPSAQDQINGGVTITFTTIDPDGAGPCLSAKDEKRINILPQPDVLLLVTQPSCTNPLGSIKMTVLAGQNLLYSIDNGTTFTANITIDNLIPNDYQLIIQSQGQVCQTTLDFKINALPISEAFWTIKSAACTDEDKNSFVLYQTSNLTLPYKITINGDTKPNVNTLPATFDNLEFGSYDVVLTDSKGCIVNKQIEFSFNSSIALSVNPIYIIDKGESVLLETDITGDYETITWTPTTWLSCGDCPEPTAKPDSSITYKITVMDSQGCSDEGTIEIRIRKKINVFIPNVISPNHDGINDGLTVFGDENVKTIRTMKIFNRWGGVVFERNNFEPNKEELGWDGSFKGQEENPMVFVYYVEVEMKDGEVKLFKGDVTVVR